MNLKGLFYHALSIFQQQVANLLTTFSNGVKPLHKLC